MDKSACVNISQVCDGQKQCTDGSDERNECGKLRDTLYLTSFSEITELIMIGHVALHTILGT